MSSDPDNPNTLASPADSRLASRKAGRPSSAVQSHFKKDLQSYDAKLKRYDCVCSYCGTKFSKSVSKKEKLEHHLVAECPEVSPEVREELQHALAAAVPENKPQAGRRQVKVVKRQGQLKQPSVMLHTDAPPMTPELANTANSLLLRMLATNGVSFRVVECPHFLAWVRSIRPTYQPAGLRILDTAGGFGS